MRTILAVITLLFATAVFAGPKEIYQDMVDGKAIIFDVRESDEVNAGMVKGATWVPLSSLTAAETATIEKVKDLSGKKSIYMYCRSGRRAQTFIDKLKTANVNATNLGGFDDLVKAGLPTQ